LWAANAWGAWFLTSGGRLLTKFLANRRDAVIADDGTRELSLFVDIDRAPSRWPLLGFGEEAPPFAELGTSVLGSTILVAQRGSESITILDLEAGSTTVHPCGCNPTGFFPLKGEAAFRLNDFGNGPISVLDISSDGVRTVLIPPDSNVVTADEGRAQLQ
jgi:hypothetical protein